VTDVELSPDGIRQAEQLGNYLSSEKIDAVYSSNLKRALVTAETIASRHQPGVITCAELREVNFGELEGLAFDEIGQRYPELTEAWVKRDTKLKYPGGDSLDEFSRRVGTFLNRLDKHTAEETILIVAHSGVLRTLICQLLGIGLERRWQFRIDLASLSIVETYSQDVILSRLNDTSHLR
jgi:broad specificity phosphatase PhoE